MYVVLVNNKPTSYDEKFLAFCDYNPTLFCSKRAAQEAIEKTRLYAVEHKHDWAILDPATVTIVTIWLGLAL